MSTLHNSPESKVNSSIMTALLGDENTTTLENRIFNTIILVGIFTGVTTGILNFFTAPISEFIISLVTTVVAAGFYIASKRFNKDRYLRIPMIVSFLLILCVGWTTNQGLQGAMPLYLFVLFVACVLMPSPYNTLLLGLSFTTVIALLIIQSYNPEMILPYSSESQEFFNLSTSLLISLGIVTLLVHLVFSAYQKERARNERLYNQALEDKLALEKALANIKVLEGILPVCAFCKKIRDEKNEWHSMEQYISGHSGAAFSHGFCPDCGNQHYSEYME